MKLRIRLAVMFYEVVILLLVCFLALFVLNVIPIAKVNLVLDIIYYDPSMRVLFGIIALILLIKTNMMARMIYGTHQKERNIAFNNPDGRVFVSLAALEDLIRRTLSVLNEVREIKAAVTVKKNGDLDVQTRLVLNGDINIPEMTSRIQKIIQRKIEGTIGSEHQVMVEVDVVKIVSHPAKDKKKKDAGESLDKESGIPFEGYRA